MHLLIYTLFLRWEQYKTKPKILNNLTPTNNMTMKRGLLINIWKKTVAVLICYVAYFIICVIVQYTFGLQKHEKDCNIRDLFSFLEYYTNQNFYLFDICWYWLITACGLVKRKSCHLFIYLFIYFLCSSLMVTLLWKIQTSSICSFWDKT